MDPEPYTLTCHTEGCENKDIPIVLEIFADTYCSCGPCGNQITDVKKKEQ